MTPERLTKAALLLYQAAEILAGDQLQANAQHLARACQLRARMEKAIVRVEVPSCAPPHVTIRQDGDKVTLINQTTGERRQMTLLDFVTHRDAETAWRSA